MSNLNRLRCPECGTRRTDPRLMVKHRLACIRPVCNCLRVPHPHRPGSYPLCEQNPMGDVLKALLEGMSEEDALELAADIAFNNPGRPSTVCPF